MPSANSFNLQAKCFVQETASSSHNFFSLTAYLKPNGSNIDLMVTAKSSSSATPNNYVIESGNISEFAVTRSSQGIYQVLYFSFIKDNHVYFKCAKFFIYGSGVSYWSDPSNPDFTVSLNPDDGQILRISPDISLRNGRPIITYRGKNVFQKWIQFNGGEDYLLSLYNYPIFVRYKYENLNNQEVWSSRTVYNSVGIEQKYPNIEGCKNGYAYVLNYNYINKYRQVAYLQNGPGYCVPGQYEVKDVKLVRGSFYGSAYPYSSPKISTLTQSTQQNLLYNIGNQSFTISDLPNGNSNISDNLLGIIREQNLNYNFALGPIIAKNTNVDFPSEVETSISNPVEFSNTMVSSPFSLGPNDTLILNGYGYYNYVSGEIFTQKRFSVNLIRKSTQGLYMTLFSDSIGVVDTTECEYLRGFVFEEGIIPEVDSFYIQLVLDSTSLEQGDNYSICNVYSPDELIEQDNPNPYKSIVHFINGNNNNNIISIPIEYSLSQNYPNPFNPVTKIQFEIPKDGLVNLKVYDVLGREVKNLINEVKSAGRYTVLLDGSDLSSGVYFYRIESGDFVQVKRMVLLK